MATPWRLFWLLVLGFHAVAASAWWWLMPGGFPATDPRFWVNRAVPIAVLAVVVTAVAASRRQRYDLLRLTLVMFPSAWAAAAIAGRVVFPISLRLLFAAPLLGAALMGMAAFLTFRGQGLQSRRLLLAIASVSALIGAVLPLAERAPAPDTRPLNTPMPESVAGSVSGGRRLDEMSSPRLRIHPGDGSLSIKAGALTLSVQPILRFLSRSPDGCWTILAPPGMRDGPDLALRSALREEGRLTLLYGADYEATLRIDPGPDEGPVFLEAMAHLSRPLFSHLNSFCDLEVFGHRRLSLSFSPCPETLIEVRPADYPVGRPIRLAFRDAQGGFHVVEASSGEKGPFHELAGGRLGQSESLSITLHDQDTALARVVLDDWSAQTGTRLSPTAGWGVPVNAIEFSLEGDLPGSPAAVYLTLAGTSVGRGWDSVGHRAGTYRNRMKIEVLGASPPPE